ncbi:MAG: N-6 DNA Methylase [Firmicutes bacterium ADurb.Bin193]|nr:MAG: N-6 DNA Methylase [Firmicutes bacterium ADurb.Bin193]
MDKVTLKRFTQKTRRAITDRLSHVCGENLESNAYIIFARMITSLCLNANGFTDSGRFAFEIPEDLKAAYDEIYADIKPVLAETDRSVFKNPEVIGRLYQSFISDLKDDAFALLQKNIKITKETLPAATQIFTPGWIAKYLVNKALCEIKDKRALEQIKLIDPCMGCGNILLYAFDEFMGLYRERGEAEGNAARLILEKNLWGLDIDEAVCALARFSLFVKAAQYDPAILSEEINTNLLCIQEDDGIFADAKQFGSLVKIKETSKEHPLYNQAAVLSQKYDAVVTNPPYMGRKSLNPKLREFIAQNYPEGKSELYAAFIMSCIEMLAEGGVCAMITLHTWLFISSFYGLRRYVLDNTSIISMLHTGAATFEELNAFNALAVAFCLKKGKDSRKSEFIRLSQYYNAKEKIKNIDNLENRFLLCQSDFDKLQKSPFIYWISDKVRDTFAKNKPLSSFASLRQGLATGDNKRFVRYWHEVNKEDIAFSCGSISEFHKTGKKYAPYNKGGGFRKWYGANNIVIAFDSESYETLLRQGNHLPSREFYFREGITWSLFGFENFSVRFKPRGFVFDVSGSSMFPEAENQKYILAFLASKVSFFFLRTIAPTVNFQVGNIASLPLIIDNREKEKIEALADENIAISKSDWDSFEESWDFSKHPLAQRGLLSENFEQWRKEAQKRYDTLVKNEEELNRIFIKIYGLEEEMSPDVSARDITIRRADLKRDIKSFISYSIGCMFGRFKDGGRGFIRKDEFFDLFVRFIESELGYTDKNLDFIAKALGSGKPRDVLDNYFNRNFYADHLKTYKNRPIYICEEDGFRYIHAKKQEGL